MNPPAPAVAIQAHTVLPRGYPNGSSTIDFYDRNAADYARATRQISLEIEIERFMKHLGAGALVLDVGCGSGRDLIALRTAGMHPTGLELSEKLAELARDYSGCSVVVGDMRDPPFADASFDGVWAAASLLHLERDELPPTLRQLRRLLKADGTFFASVKLGMGTERSADGRLFSYFMPEEWSELLTSAGFAEVQIETQMRNSTAGDHTAWLQSLSRAP